MRKLQFQDGFKVARILKKACIKEKLQEKLADFANDAGSEKEVEKAGLEIVFTLLECAGSEGVEQEVYELLGGIFEMEANKVAALDLETLNFNMTKLLKENDVVNFFKKAVSLM